MWVLKLGGSLLSPRRDGSGANDLSDWLQAIEQLETPLVIVPGGGPFADQVRAAQSVWQFDDQNAHRMALLAMEQFAHLLCGLSPRLTTAASLSEIRTISAAGRIPVWLPYRLVAADQSISADWSVTSDSLAAWLAEQLQCCGLLLVKSAGQLLGPAMPLNELQAEGVIDQAFGATADGCTLALLHRAHSHRLADVLNSAR